MPMGNFFFIGQAPTKLFFFRQIIGAACGRASKNLVSDFDDSAALFGSESMLNDLPASESRSDFLASLSPADDDFPSASSLSDLSSRNRENSRKFYFQYLPLSPSGNICSAAEQAMNCTVESAINATWNALIMMRNGMGWYFKMLGCLCQRLMASWMIHKMSVAECEHIE